MIPRWADTDAEALAEALAVLHREAEVEWQAEEEATELEDRDRAERGERYEDWRT